MKKNLTSRLNILFLMICAAFLIFSVRLVKLQIIDGRTYFDMSNSRTRINQTVTAARGDITDVYGIPLAGKRTVFNVTFNKAYMPDGTLNERIFDTVKILNRHGETINDILPITSREPYEFITDTESRQIELGRVRDTIKVAEYATERDIINKLCERYEIENIPEEYIRTIAGIRYTMERDGYSAAYPFTVARDVSVETATAIKELSRKLEGVEINETSARYYRDGTLLPHILGTVGPIYAEEYEELKDKGYKLNDTLGKSGIEKTYESYLKGTDGVIQIEKNMYGEITGEDVVTQPQPGNTVKLTIDAELQKRANQILSDQVDLLHSHSAGWGKECTAATMVVLDVKTGAILAVSNYPSYDLNLYSENYSRYSADENTPLFNRAFQGLYRPGSVFKLSVAAAGLASGLIDENFTYTCTGTYNYYTSNQWGGSPPGCASRTAHGTINVKEAIKVSCNCFFYDLGRRLGIDAVNNSAMSFGLGVKTGTEINEETGILSSPRHTEELGGIWQAGNVIQASIGQLDTMVTPLELATYVSTVANRGTRYSVHIVDSIVSYDGKEEIYKTPTTVLYDSDAPDSVYDIIEEGMIMASTEGNAAMYLNGLPYTIASKTGTAQVSGGLYNATMIAYGPVANPELAIAIVAEKGGNGYNLAYAVREIFRKYYELKAARSNPEYAPSIYDEPEQSDERGESVTDGESAADSDSQDLSESGSDSISSQSSSSAQVRDNSSQNRQNPSQSSGSAPRDSLSRSSQSENFATTTP